jgi:hypothetical protein
MSPVQRMTKRRDAWKTKATERATELRELRKEIVKARARHNEDKRRIAELQAQCAASSPPFCPSLVTLFD